MSQILAILIALSMCSALYAKQDEVIAPAAAARCEGRLVRLSADNRYFMDRTTLVSVIANHKYGVAALAEERFPKEDGGPSLSDVLNSEILGGAINNDKESLSPYFGANSDLYTGMWFLVGRFNAAARIRDHFVINLAVEKETQAVTVVDVRPAVQRTVQVYTAAISAIGRDEAPSRYRIRPLMGCANLEVPSYIIEKLENRHEIYLEEVLEALNSQTRTFPQPYLDRGLVVKDQYTLFGFTGTGRKVRLGLKREFQDKVPVWRLLTAFFKD